MPSTSFLIYIMSNRSFFPLTVASVLLFSACSGTAPVAPGTEGTSRSSAAAVVSSVAYSASSKTADAAPSLGTDVANPDAQAGTRIIDIEAKNWAFVPSVIKVAQGDDVMLRITSTTGTHGFAVADLDIDVSVPEGETVEVILPTDKAGTFSFKCSIPCGEGHKDMTGTIEVTAS